MNMSAIGVIAGIIVCILIIRPMVKDKSSKTYDPKNHKKRCQYCREWIDENAAVCPFCRNDPDMSLGGTLMTGFVRYAMIGVLLLVVFIYVYKLFTGDLT